MSLVPFSHELQVCRRNLLAWEERLRSLTDRARASEGTLWLVVAIASLRERMDRELSGDTPVPGRYGVHVREALATAERHLMRARPGCTHDECLAMLADALVAISAECRRLESLVIEA